MSRSRSLSWSSALRDLRDDRAKPKNIREEQLRAAIPLSSWRGEHGKRYVFGRGALSMDTVARAAEQGQSLVLIAARRIGATPAEIIDIYAGNAADPEIAEWIDRSRAWGANELHSHTFAHGAVERAAVVADLTDDALRARQAAIAECRDGIAALIGEAA